jgi:hypothetical protein
MTNGRIKIIEKYLEMDQQLESFERIVYLIFA